MKPTTFSAALFALASVGAAQAQQDVITSATSVTQWDGFYVGGNVGGAWNHSCNSWQPGNAIKSNPALSTAFYNRDCPNNSAFIGGVDLGYFWQYENWVFGAGADWDGIGSSSKTHHYSYAGGLTDPIPAGTYTTQGRVSPDGIVLVGPKIGYAIDQWLPYIRFGAAFSLGSTARTNYYTGPLAPGGARLGSATKNFDSSGWNVGAGVEYNLFGNGPWTLNAEYNYVNLGKGSNNSVSCATLTAAFCSAYSNFQLDNIHNSFTLSMFRVGFHYNFGRQTEEAPPPAPPPPPPPAEAPPPPPPPPAKAESLCPDTPAGVKVDQYGCPCDVSQEVHFATDSAVLTDQDMALLNKVINNLKRLPFVDGEIDGYTDATGRAAYNQGLSERRAQAVVDYLTQNGISTHRLVAKGYGEDNPVADNSTPEGRAHNRRVVLHRTNCGK